MEGNITVFEVGSKVRVKIRSTDADYKHNGKTGYIEKVTKDALGEMYSLIFDDGTKTVLHFRNHDLEVIS